MSEKAQEVRLLGQAISQGLAIGRAFVYREKLELVAGADEIEEHQVEEELRRIDQALETVAKDLSVSASRIEGDTDTKFASIFEAHQAMLQDPVLRQEIHALIHEDWVSAAHALSLVFRRWERKFREMTELTLRQRADDIADLRRRLLRELAGVKTTSLEKMPLGHVLVARRLLPSDTVALPRCAVAGIIVESGGPGSHAALLAEALGIPTVAQIPNATETISDNDEVIVDGFRGEVTLHPQTVTRKHYLTQIEGARTRTAQVKYTAQQSACTLDGTVVGVLANVGCCEDVVAAAENGADGVGLFRIEQFYLSRSTPPAVPELLAELRRMFGPVKGKPVTVRLLDLGGDKPLPFLKLPPEDNPFLGQRGVRFLLRYPDLLDTQLQAFCQFSLEQELRILVPMVTVAEEMAFIRSRLVAVAKDTGCETPSLGAMIETPAAALSVPEIKAHADFLSIGTNDLTQYTMAAGRENPLVNDYYREDHPAVLRLVSLIVEEAGQMPVTLCGELARQVEVLPVLLKLGLRVLSMAPPLIPGLKQAIRQIAL
ncbi:MAG TPA: phosphoenolpyruvate--protein phosphotransferase [Clostridia bacterium]|nr:phosphoenolpyruvate--protein phosphotransferase [Clostridia bacterium]